VSNNLGTESSSKSQARSQDAPPAGTLEELHEELRGLSLEGHWQRVKVGSSSEPHPRCEPYLWHWDDLYRNLQSAAKLITLAEDAERRTIRLINPATAATTRTTLHTVHTSVQLVNPGEVATAHRHSMGAIRFALKGRSTVTTVDGEPMPMHPRDLILTPKWTWHDHVNAGADETVWLDGLDSPLIQYLGIRFQEPYGPQRQQQLDRRRGGPVRFGLLRYPDEVRVKSLDLPLRYPWEAVEPQLEEALGKALDPYDGALLEYANPTTNGHTLPTLACFAQAMPPGFEGRPIRQTSAGIYHVLEGSGTVQVGDVKLEWSPGDFFAIPNWSWRHFEVSDKGRAVFFMLSDLPQIEAFGFYREESDKGLLDWGVRHLHDD